MDNKAFGNLNHHHHLSIGAEKLLQREKWQIKHRQFVIYTTEEFQSDLNRKDFVGQSGEPYSLKKKTHFYI